MGEGFGANLFGDLGGLFSNMFMQNPADAAMPYYNQIPGTLNNIFQPYTQAGLNAVQPFTNQNPNIINEYMGQTNALTHNPSGFMNALGSTFQQSPGYNWQKNQAMQAVNNAAVAGGMAGSPMQQQNSANVVNQLANQDYYNYLNHVMDVYNRGYGGLGNMYGIGANIAGNMYNAGANLTGQYASDLASAMMNQGNMKYLSGVNQNQQTGGLFGSLAGLGGLAMDFL